MLETEIQRLYYIFPQENSLPKTEEKFKYFLLFILSSNKMRQKITVFLIFLSLYLGT